MKTVSISMKRTADALLNLVSHLGDARDKQAYSSFDQPVFAYGELEEAFRSWLPHKMVRIIPEDMTREGRTVKVEDDDPKPFSEFCEEIQLLDELGWGYSWGRLYGGGGVYMVIKNDDPRTPLDLEKVSKDNPLTALIPFDMYDVTTELNETAGDPNWLRPKTFKFSEEDPIHWTRVLGPFDGYRLPNRLQKANNGWGGSQVEKDSEAALQAMSTNSSIASLMHRANSPTIGIKGLLQKTQSATKTEELRRRFETAALLLSNNGFLLYDKDQEELGKLDVNMSSVGGIIPEMLTVVAAAVEVPVTRFLGTPPKGLNATGEGDRKDYQSVIKGRQNSVFGPQLRRVDPVIARSVYGKDAKISYEWNPLEQLSDLDQTQADKNRAETHKIYKDMGAIKPSNVAQNLLEREEYSDLDQEAVDKLREEEKNAPDSAEPPVVPGYRLSEAQPPDSGELPDAE